MSYTKVTLTPAQQALLLPNEIAVKLDTGDFIAVGIHLSVQGNSGNGVVKATARAVNTDGSARLDANGQAIASALSHTTNIAEVTSVGGIGALEKLVAMAVLGEPTAPLWQDPLHATMLANASIRTYLTSAANAGPVNAGALL